MYYYSHFTDKKAEAQISWMTAKGPAVGSQDKNSGRLAAEPTLLTTMLGNLFQRPWALQIMRPLLCQKEITLFLIFESLSDNILIK